MHGYTDNAIRHRNYTKLNRIADENNFIVVYPRGTKDKEGERFFNMGYFFHQTETVDDVGFLTELTLYLQDKYSIDKERTFTSGFSNGGDMSYMLACQRPDIFKGFVSIGGLMLEDFKEDCEYSIPIPVFEIRGELDAITLYDGDINNETGWGHYPPIEETIDFWKSRNNCTTVIRDTLYGPKGDDYKRVEITKFLDCTDDKEVWLYKITDYKHQWPQGTDNHWLSASDEIANRVHPARPRGLAKSRAAWSDPKHRLPAFRPCLRLSATRVHPSSQSTLYLAVENVASPMLALGHSGTTSSPSCCAIDDMMCAACETDC